MSAHQNQQQRLSDVTEAFLTLSIGEKMTRREIFGGAARDQWHNRLLQRLCEEELLIKHDSTNIAHTAYEAVDGEWFVSISEDKIRLAEWYFKRGIVISKDPPAAEAEEAIEVPAPIPEKIEEALVKVESASVPEKILETLILCAQNLVYLRDRVEALHAKVDVLTGDLYKSDDT